MTEEKKSWKSNFTALRYIPRFFSLIWETNRNLFIGNGILRLIKSLIPAAMLWIGKLIIDEVVLQISAPEKDLSQMWIFLAIELSLAILSDILNRAINLIDGLLGDLFGNKSSVELIQKAARMELRLFEDANFYDKLERARRQTTNRVTLMSTVLSQIQDLITVFSLAAMLIAFQPFLVLLLVIAIIPSFLNEIKFSRSSYSLVRSWTPERRELDYLRFIGASDATAKEVKLFGLASFLSSRFAKLANKYYLANRLLAIKRAVWGSVYHIIGDISYYTAYVIIIIRTVSGAISLGELTLLAGSFRGLRGQLQTIFSRMTRITESALYLKDYFDFMDIEFNQTDRPVRAILSKEIRIGFEFKNVSFKYPGTDEFVLKNLSFKLHPGEKLALVGENGAGKTTLIKLLLRMYKPTAGQILVDGEDILNFDPDSYHQLFGVIFQDFVKYHFKAKENIAIGKIDELANREKIYSAAHKSLADQVIDALPDKYEQQLGRRFHHGVELSIGQWQKIALARAYMKDAQIIILDEPTSSLDARAEFEAFQRFIDLTKGKMAVLISHRFSTVRMADRIIVLQDGRLLESGTHEELMENDSLYAELFGIQARAYF